MDLSEDNYDTLLVILDHSFCKEAVLVPTVKIVTVTGTAKLLKDNIFQHYRLPESLISNRDPHFETTRFQEWLKLLGIKSAMSTAYHSQMDGAMERLMQKIQVYLLIYIFHHQLDQLAKCNLYAQVYSQFPTPMLIENNHLSN